MVREVQIRLHAITRAGKRALYRAVISGADAHGMKRDSYFRFRIRTASGGLSSEFVPKLLARAREDAIMVTVPPAIIETAGLTSVSESALQLIGPASAREAAEAAGKGSEYSKAYSRLVRRKRAHPADRKAWVEEKKAEGMRRPRVTKAEREEASVQVTQEPEAPTVPPAEAAPTPKPEEIPERPQEAESVGEGPAPVASGVSADAEVAPPRLGEKKGEVKKVKRRGEAPDILDVEKTVVAMKKKIIYLHLVPDIIMGRLKTKRQVDEASDSIMVRLERSG